MEWVFTVLVSLLCGVLAGIIYGKLAKRSKPNVDCRKHGACCAKNELGNCQTAGWVSIRCKYYKPKAEEGE